jgi:hypothetical protein
MKKLMQEVKQVKSTDVINTTELKSLLDSSKEAIELKDAMIKSVEEVDETIDLKRKVTNFNNLARDLFTKDFPSIISIMDLKADRREKLSEVIRVLEPKLNAISESASSCEKAGEEFRTKYEIELVDEAGK